MIRQVQACTPARQIIPLLLASVLLVACSSFSSSTASLTDKPLNDEGTASRAFSAALTPLEDIGLRKRNIPQMLQMLSENPYLPPETIQCDEIKHELADLTVLLGPDLDAPKAVLTAQEAAMEDGGNLVQDAVVGLVKSQADFLPFRSVLRRLTGAASHEKAVARAVDAGKLRRAYLRGMADARFGQKCIPHIQVVKAPASEEAPKDLEIAAK